MNHRFWARLCTLGAALSLACGPSQGETTSSAITSVSATGTERVPAPPSASAEARTGRGTGQGQGQGQKRFGDSAAYVDGKALGVLRYFELPPDLKYFNYPLANGKNAQRYRVAEYIEAVGVPLDKVKAVHFVGGRNRTAVVAGEEIRKQRDVLAFSFTRETAGKARMHWPPGIQSNTTIDAIVNLLIYVEREVPTYDSKKKAFFDKETKRFEGVPYADPDAAIRGTRVYVDGVYQASVKRKLLPDAVLSPRYSVTNPVFSVEKYLGWIGAKPQETTTFAVVQGDSVVLRMDQKSWKTANASLDFLISKGSEGRVIVLGEDGSTRFPAHSLHVFSKKKPHQRLLTAPIEPPNPGSEEAQPAPEESPE